MADKAISDLPNLETITDDALLVAEQDSTAWKIFFSQLRTWIEAAASAVAKGDPGDPGIPPHIGDNGNWWIGDTDTGVPATGPAGDGSGDMVKATYDTENRNTDVFIYVDGLVGAIADTLDEINGEVV